MNKVIKAFVIAILIFMFPIVAGAENGLYVASISGEVTLKILPDDKSQEIISIPACSKVSLLKKSNTWGLVAFENKCGWINLAFTAENYADAANSTGKDKAGNVKVHSKEGSVNLYNVPSVNENLGSTVKYTVPNDTILNVVRETDSGWTLASMNGKFAWVETRYTQKYQSLAEEKTNSFGIYYVYVMSENGKGLELRKSRKSGEILALIPDCIKLTVRKKEDTFGYVSYNGYNGWIDLRYTTNSLANAQAGAGVVVNKEMSVNSQTGEVNIMSLPTDNHELGNTVMGSVKNGTAVFVQRQTQAGWSYVNNSGVKGWIMPGTLSEADAESVMEIKTVTPYCVFAADEGVDVLSEPKGEKVCLLPPGMEVRIIAENEGYGYAVCSYASGWIELSKTASSYSEVIDKIKKTDIEIYTIINQAEIKSIPIKSELYGDIISVLEEDEEVIVYAKVKVGSGKWGLVKAGGSWGWLNLSNAKKIAFPIAMVFIILSIVLALALAVTALILIIRRKRR